MESCRDCKILLYFQPKFHFFGKKSVKNSYPSPVGSAPLHPIKPSAVQSGVDQRGTDAVGPQILQDCPDQVLEWSIRRIVTLVTFIHLVTSITINGLGEKREV